MTTNVARWFVPAVGILLGVLIAAAELGRGASPLEATVAFAIVAGYVLVLRALQSRSDMASVLSGLPTDERGHRSTCARSFAGQSSRSLVVAYLVTQFSGGDSPAYAQLAGSRVATRGLVWYRARS
jgi:hypothetical protein